MERYMAQRQAVDGVPKNQQIVLQVVSVPTTPRVRAGRPKGPTMFIFVALSCLAVAAAYVRENLQRETRPMGLVRPRDETDARSDDAVPTVTAVSVAVDDAAPAVTLQPVGSSSRQSKQPPSRRQTLALERRSEER